MAKTRSWSYSELQSKGWPRAGRATWDCYTLLLCFPLLPQLYPSGREWAAGGAASSPVKSAGPGSGSDSFPGAARAAAPAWHLPHLPPGLAPTRVSAIHRLNSPNQGLYLAHGLTRFCWNWVSIPDSGLPSLSSPYLSTSYPATQLYRKGNRAPRDQDAPGQALLQPRVLGAKGNRTHLVNA